MAGRAFVVAKELFVIETVVFWHCDRELFWCKFSYVNNHLYSMINFNNVKLRFIEPCICPTKRETTKHDCGC